MTYVLGSPYSLGSIAPADSGPFVLSDEAGSGSKFPDRCAILRPERQDNADLGFGTEETVAQFATDVACKFVAPKTLREQSVAGAAEGQAVVTVQFPYGIDVRATDTLRAEVVAGINFDQEQYAAYFRVLETDAPHSEGVVQNVKAVRVKDYTP